MQNTNHINEGEFRVGILTISDSGFKGDRETDVSGNTIMDMISDSTLSVIKRDMVPDEVNAIADTLRAWSDSGEIDVVLTTGGTGLGPRDVTPEATKSILDIEVQGIAEAMRMKTFEITPYSMLRRSVSGVRSGCLIINLPGSPKAVKECLDIVLPSIPHGLQIIRGSGWSHEKA